MTICVCMDVLLCLTTWLRTAWNITLLLLLLWWWWFFVVVVVAAYIIMCSTHIIRLCVWSLAFSISFFLCIWFFLSLVICFLFPWMILLLFKHRNCGKLINHVLNVFLLITKIYGRNLLENVLSYKQNM